MIRVSFFLFLLPLFAQAGTTQLECDGDGTVVFHSRWIRTSTVTISSTMHWEFPWTGRETQITGAELKQISHEQSGGDAISEATDATSFAVFHNGEDAPRALEPILYVQRELLDGSEQDGLVIARIAINPHADTHDHLSRFRVFHCRSR